ncbi:unnamed protein product [Heligmosomoides polygyrus]|uniref:Secreted protein n=1 Tax=Heligmosomoides polygyrus TaxID=6339 RepID=A0A183G0F4_HELPZ|nr:unnamed protein product [Heligmosomoides polygyrus]
MGPIHLPGVMGLGSFGCPMGQVGVPRVNGTAAAIGPPICNRWCLLFTLNLECQTTTMHQLVRRRSLEGSQLFYVTVPQLQLMWKRRKIWVGCVY